MEGRALELGGMRLSTSYVDATASRVLRKLAALLGTTVSEVDELWEDSCTRERLAQGAPVGGGRLFFTAGGQRHDTYLSFDYWFDFGHVSDFAEKLGHVGAERIYTTRAHAAAVRGTAAEARRLAIDWGLVLDED